jgi:hypothetical protein
MSFKAKKVLQSVATRVPKVVIPRDEEIYASLMETTVSVLCFLSSKNFVVFSWI